MTLTFVVLAVTIVLFIWGKLRPDIVAVLSVLALYLLGIINTDQALSGFGNATVVMIAALFVVGAGLSETGVTVWVGSQLLKLAGSSKPRLLIMLMLGTASLSAFISNTGTVATLMPATVSAAWSIGSIPGQFLMPLAFAANSGGLLTLTGTPPNIVVANALADIGLEPFSFFEFGLIGLPLLITAILYMKFVGQRLLPKQSSAERPIDIDASLGELSKTYALPDSVYRLRVRAGSRLVDKTLKESALGHDYGVAVLRVEHAVKDDAQNGSLMRDAFERRQQGERIPDLGPDTVIRANDVLWVKGEEAAIQRIMTVFTLGLKPTDEAEVNLKETLLSKEVGLAEVVIIPRSEYTGRTIAGGQLASKFHVQVLSVCRQDKALDLRKVRLAAGDSLLIRGTWEAISRMQQERRNFVVVGSPKAMAQQIAGLGPRAIVSVAALIGMVILMVSGWVPTVIATLIAAMSMVLGGCLTMSQAYRAINWNSVILIAAMIPMSSALETTGGAEFMANGLVNSLGAVHPIALMAGIFLLTTGFSQVISNTATAVLVSPIVLQAAQNLGVSPYPMLMIVAVSASTAFLTPIGTTTNLMVMTPGDYQFSDYFKTGLPLLLLFLVISLLLVPIIWPL